MKARFFLALAVSFCLAVGSKSLLAAGASTIPDENLEGTTGALKAQIQTGGSYDIQSGNATRIVNDLHVPGALGVYGLDFTRYWNSLHPEDTNFDAEWPLDFAYSGWSHSWRWSAIYGDELPDFEQGQYPHTYITSITITFPDGHVTKFKIARTDGGVGIRDPRVGPPYSNPGETDWPSVGAHVHDRLDSMAYDGHEFWLSRADGGSVHFVGLQPPDTRLGYPRWDYQATEVFDPHGLKTQLHYTDGYLDQVTQDGGRSLLITWGQVDGLAGPAIASVDSKGPNGEQIQHVSYWYSRCGGPYGNAVLSRVDYENEPAPGQTSSAIYTYDMKWGDGPNAPFPVQEPTIFPILKAADDPHFAGPMTKISYKYWGTVCRTHPPPNCGVECANWFYFTPETVIEERSVDRYNTVVSSFNPVCETGGRTEANGIGGQRSFYFGRHEGIYAWGSELTSATDFYQPYTGTPIRRRQDGAEPSMVWDGRDILTQMAWNDGSGSPSQVHYVDGSNYFYDRVNKGASEEPDLTRVHNQWHHWLFKKTDELNNSTIYTRDSRRRVKRIDYQDGSYETFSYDNTQPNTLNLVTEHRLPSGAVEHYEYNELHQVVREFNDVDIAISPSDYKFYTYYGPGNHPEWTGLVEMVIDGPARVAGAPFTVKMTYNGRQQVTSMEYPPTGGDPHPTVRYEYDIYGNRTAVVNELGHREVHVYDDYRRPISFIEQVNGPGPNGVNITSRRTDWIYDRVIDGIGGTPFHGYSHTSKDWRIEIGPEFNANRDRRATARTFDVNNRITSEQTGLVHHNGDALGTLHIVNGVTGIQRFTYDENGQKQTSTDPLGRLTTYGYNNRNRLESTTEPKRADQATNPVTRFTYDVAGNKLSVTFPDNNTQQWGLYDAFGQAWKFTDERHHDTDLIYKQWGPMKKLQRVTTYRERDNPPGGTEAQPTSFEYDGMGRPFTTSFPDSSTEVTSYKLGHISKYKTRRDQTKVIDQYDARDRPLHHYWLKADGVTPDGNTPAVTSVWDDASRLTRIANVFSTIDYTYDEVGQVVTETSSVAGSGGQTPLGTAVARQLNYRRYPSGEVAQITYPNGAVVTREYTARGQLAGVGWGAGSTSFAYLPDGKVDYQAWTNNVLTTYGYDGRGMMSSVLHRRTAQQGQDLARRDYWRNDRDQILAWKRGTAMGPNAMENGLGDRFAYDEEGQLTLASYRVQDPAGAATGAMRADIFGYDKMGNRMGTQAIASHGTTNFSRDNNGLNQYSSWTGSSINQDDDMGGEWGSPGHANGVTMQEGWITASFNALNQPMAMWCRTYASNYLWFGYDPLGRCVKRWMGPATGNAPNSNAATYFYYDGVDMVQEWNSAVNAPRIYVHGAGVDQIVASQASTGEWRYHHYDGQGNCILLTDTSGNIQEQYDYDAFGMPYVYNAGGYTLAPAAQWGNRFLFTGREWLSDLRIYDYRARQYQPELGRFLQPDPKEFAAGDYNLYRYCHNDPVNRNDPTGLDSVDNADGTFSFTFQHQLPMRNVVGWAVMKSSGKPLQCAGAAQVLAGTWMKDGLHDVPQTINWQRGPELSKQTPAGTLIAKGWDDKGHYLNTDNTKPGYQGNHAGFFLGYDKSGKTIYMLDQSVSPRTGDANPLQVRQYAANAGWARVDSREQRQERASVPILRPPDPNHSDSQIKALAAWDKMYGTRGFGATGQ